MAYWNAGGAVIDRAGGSDWNAPAAIPSLVPAFPPRPCHDPPARIRAEASRAAPRSTASGICCRRARCHRRIARRRGRRRRRSRPDHLGRHQRGDLCCGACRFARHGVRAALQHSARALPAAGGPTDRGRQHRDAAACRTATASRSWWRRGWSTAAAWSPSRHPAATLARRIRVDQRRRGCTISSHATARTKSSAARLTRLRSRHPELSAGVGRPRRMRDRWRIGAGPCSPRRAWRWRRPSLSSAPSSSPGPRCGCSAC